MVGGQRRLNMTAIREAPDFDALKLTESEEEQVYAAEKVRCDEFEQKVGSWIRLEDSALGIKHIL